MSLGFNDSCKDGGQCQGLKVNRTNPLLVNAILQKILVSSFLSVNEIVKFLVYPPSDIFYRAQIASFRVSKIAFARQKCCMSLLEFNSK